MNTMLATTDTMALTRMAVIGKRTNSVLMAEVKPMMVEKVKNQMRNGVAHFVYMKKSGEIREAFGLFRSISSDYEATTKEKQDKSCDLSCLVAGGGLDPPAAGL